MSGTNTIIGMSLGDKGGILGIPESVYKMLIPANKTNKDGITSQSFSLKRERFQRIKSK